MAHITISHSRAEGTLVDGSRKGDGVFELIKPHGFAYFPSLGCLGLRRSRDKRAQMWRINGAAEALRTAGHEVTISIDEDTRRSFAEAEAERQERAADRAERCADRSGRAADSAAARDAAARRIADGIPFGQPILVGHHSERRARRDAERIDTNMRKSIAEQDRADYWADRAHAAEHYERYRSNPGTTLRRIEKLEADLRGIERRQAALAIPAEQITNPEAPAGGSAELMRLHEEITEEIAYWRRIIAEAEAAGFKVWGAPDFTKGDFARSRGRWYEVLRVNAKTLTVPGGPDIQKVITRENRAFSWDDRIPYANVSGRKSAAEMRRLLGEAGADSQ